MPQYEKWLHAATPDAPSDEIARSALTERLLAVSHFLKKSVGGKKEAEAIHQLRVWTRRAGAAIDLFEPGIPNKRCKKLQKTLRQLRRAAGDVRDCELQQEQLKQIDDPPHKAQRSLKKCQRKAQRRLKQLRRKLRKDDWLDLQIEQFLSRIGWPKRHSSRKAPPFRTLCGRQLAPLGADFFRQARKDLRDFNELHQLRIAGKQLRYALELAVAVVPPRIHHKLYEALNDLQDRAGEVCDQRAFLNSVQEWLDAAPRKKSREQWTKLLNGERRKYEAMHRKFLGWWTDARRRAFLSLWKKAL